MLTNLRKLSDHNLTRWDKFCLLENQFPISPRSEERRSALFEQARPGSGRSLGDFVSDQARNFFRHPATTAGSAGFSSAAKAGEPGRPQPA